MKYILAVSGGVDSVVLLDMLAQLRHEKSSLELVVAHVDHGIRPDSDADAWHVATLAKRYELPYEVTYLGLGRGASEDLARQERYKWLREVKARHKADGIITAHHMDDLIETIFLNIGRGTGWRGMASLRTTDELARPLLDLSKANLIRYAIDRNLTWREDSTNDDLRYTRNYIRQVALPKLTPEQRRQLSQMSAKQKRLRRQIEKEVEQVLESICNEVGIRRYNLIMMPDSVALEVLRAATSGKLEPFQLRRLLHFVKTGRQGAVLNLGRGKNALLTKQRLIV